MIRTLSFLLFTSSLLLAESLPPPKLTAGERTLADLAQLQAVARLGGENVTLQADFQWMSDTRAIATLALREGAALEFVIEATPEKNGELKLVTSVSATADLPIETMALRLPLKLEERKRVVQAGENGTTWEIRSRYHFTTPMNSTRERLPYPDINIWRTFRSDWLAGDTYHLTQSESWNTAPLIQHSGTGFPGWSAVYDQRGGVAVALDEAVFRTERAIQIETEQQGVLQIDLHPAAARPQIVKSGWSDQLALRLLPFAEVPRNLGHRMARRPTHSGPPARRIAVAPAPVFTVSGGVPLAQGALRPDAPIGLRNEEGALVPLQSAPLAYWPDGSIKWIELIFSQQNAGKTNDLADESPIASFHVANGTGAKAAYALYQQQTVAAPKTSVTIAKDDAQVSIKTGPLEARFQPGKTWWPELRVSGQSAFTGKSGAVAYLELLRADPAKAKGRFAGAVERGEFVAKTIRVEEEGPLRAVIRIEGETGGRHPSRVTLRLTFHAGSTAIHGAHTWVVGAWDPREWYVSGLGLELPLGLKKQAAEVTAEAGEKRFATPLQEGASLTALHPDALILSAERKDGSDRIAAGPTLENALSVSANDQGVSALLRNMRELFPAGISARPSGKGVLLTLEFWPRNASPMDLRRYSDFPHRGQGESVPVQLDWVKERFYAEDPVRGISRTHEFMIMPWSGEPPALAPLASALGDRPLVVSSEQTYLATGILSDDLTAPGLAPARANLHRFAEFLDYHRRKWRWYGKWVYGDIQHAFRRGYGRMVEAEVLVGLLQTNQKKLPPGTAIYDYAPPNDWAFDNGRWGWTNTEGLPNRYLSECYLRTGDRALFFDMEALAQHSRDVVIRHEGRFFGAGTRHGVQPWSDGAHQERMTIPSEWRIHRLLTGDPRSRDVLLRYGYEVFLQPKRPHIQGGPPLVTADADHSARLYGLLTLWEATHDSKVADALARYIDQLLLPEGIGGRVSIEFPEIKRVASSGTIHPGSMFFQTFGAMYALSEYAVLTDDRRLMGHLEKMAAHAISEPKYFEKGRFETRDFYWPAVAFAARHAQDPKPYRDFIKNWLTTPAGAFTARQIVTENRDHWSGPTGALLDSLMPVTLFHVNVLPSLVAPLESLPDPKAPQELERREIEGKISPLRSPSWQSEYDRPELQDYLNSPFKSGK